MEENVNINVNTNADEAAQEFGGLTRQIRQATIALQQLEQAGVTSGAEFDAARERLDNLNDTLERSRFRAGQLDDQLAALPGPVGQAGQAFKGFNETLNILRANPIFFVLTGLVGTFLLFKKALDSTAEGQATLAKLTTAAQRVLAPFLVLVEKVAVPIFNKLADLLIATADSLEYWAIKLGLSKKKIDEKYDLE